MTKVPATPMTERAIVLYGRASFDHGQTLKARGDAVTVATAHADLSGPALPAAKLRFRGLPSCAFFNPLQEIVRYLHPASTSAIGPSRWRRCF